ncbi:MAG TPA: hypothetical protein VEZ55_11795, partial [Chitinophagaceae bacterium]|nr:hypothetical protein [Chitinophagaceae bacterium]
DTKEDYTEDVDKAAGTAAQLLLSTPMDKESLARLNAGQFLIRWMTGTPTYTFSIDAVATKISKGNKDLMLVYLAAMVKYCLDNPLESKNDNKVKFNTVQRVLDYCKEQGVNLKGELKKLNAASEKGELEKYLQ